MVGVLGEVMVDDGWLIGWWWLVDWLMMADGWLVDEWFGGVDGEWLVDVNGGWFVVVHGWSGDQPQWREEHRWWWRMVVNRLLNHSWNIENPNRRMVMRSFFANWEAGFSRGGVGIADSFLMLFTTSPLAKWWFMVNGCWHEESWRFEDFSWITIYHSSWMAIVNHCKPSISPIYTVVFII